MAIAQVQKATQADTNDALAANTATLASNPAKGSLIIRCGSVFDDAGTSLNITSVVDANGDPFRVVKAFGSTGAVRGIAYLAYRWGSDSSAAAKAVTVNVTGRVGTLSWAGQGVMEYNGGDIGDVLELSQSVADVNTVATDVGFAATGTLSKTGILALAQMMYASSSANEHILAPSGFTLEYVQQDSATYVGAATASQILAATTTFTPTFSHDNGASSLGSGVLLLLRPAASGAGSGRRRGSMNGGMM